MPVREGFALRDPQLLRDEVEAGDRLGDRVLDLDAAVELEEMERAVLHDELDRPGAPVADGATERDGRLEERLAQLCVEAGSRRLLEHLLVPPLHGAFPLAERDHVPVRIREQLHLDVTRAFEVALEIERPVAECADGLPLGCLQRLVELPGRAHHPHAAPAASRCGLHDEREADLLRRALGQRRHACLARDPLRRELVTAEPQRLRRRPDPREPRRLDRLGEVRVLRQEPVARMDRVGACRLRRADVLLGVEVARDLDRLVGRARVQRPRVVGRDHRDRRDALAPARAEDAQRDLSAVRHEQLPDRHEREL